MNRIFEITTIGERLLFGGATLFVVLLVFSNMNMLPLGVVDFIFFFILATLGATYRPGWIFLLLVLSLPIEMISLTPDAFRFDLRPYQFLELSLFLGLFLRFLSRRAIPRFPRFGLSDAFIFLVPIGSLLALVNASSPSASLKLSLVLISLFGLYVLARMYLQSFDDVRKTLPFVFVSGGIVLVYAIFQNVRFLLGMESFEVMPGRPDGGLPEPDWLGMYLALLASILFAILAFIRRELTSVRWNFATVFAVLVLIFSVLLMSVSRSAWLGVFVSGAVSLGIFAYIWRDVRMTAVYASGIGTAFFVALAFVALIPLTRFDLFGRAMSTAGLQEITVSCDHEFALPENIADVSELSGLGCRHIDLEEIESELAAGSFISTVKRPDPNVEIRKDIYGISWEKIKEYPILGIGWGSIGAYLGTDERGAALNASNIFLEIWLGSGLLGFLGFLLFWLSIPFFAIRQLFRPNLEAGLPSEEFLVFAFSAWAGLTIFNLFNSGILLGFFWIFFAVALAARLPRNS